MQNIDFSSHIFPPGLYYRATSKNCRKSLPVAAAAPRKLRAFSSDLTGGNETGLRDSSPAPTPPKWGWSLSARSFPLTLGLMLLQPNKWGICLQHKRIGMMGRGVGDVDVTRQTDVPLYYPSSSSSLPCVLETRREIDHCPICVLPIIAEMCY